MARKQTRRAISLNRHLYAAILREAERAGVSAAQFVSEAVLARIPTFKVKIGYTPTEKVRLMKQGRERARLRAIKVPTVPAVDVAAVIAKHQRKHRVQTPNSERARKASLGSAAELRRLGVLKPENEGYAPGSWAAEGQT